MNNITEEKKIIGEFKPKRRFLNFISAIKGAQIRLINNYAFIKGSKLSGMLEGLKFKITICDEGTINFEEINATGVTDKDLRQRLIDDIDSMSVTGYAQKFIVDGISFEDENGSICYLEVENKKPIDMLKSIIGSIKDEKPELSSKGLSILNDLFGEDEDDDIIEENNPIENEEKSYEKKSSFLEEQFIKLNNDKIDELKQRIEKSEINIIKIKSDISQSELKLKEETKGLEILKARLDSMYSGDDPNGYIFYISEELHNMDLIESDRKIVDKIANLIGVDENILFEKLSGGFYQIKIAKKDDITNNDFKIDKDILDKILSIDVSGKISLNGDCFEYRGELNWHQLVDRMIRKGFEQNSEFDKLCKSNSYESHEQEKGR